MKHLIFWDYIKRYDYSFFFISTIIFIIGIFNLYSATHQSSSLSISLIYKTQLIWYLLSIIVGVVVSLIYPKNYFTYAYIFYVVMVFILLLVLFTDYQGISAKRWLRLGSFSFQPSEITKISVILFCARWFSRSEPNEPLNLRKLIIPLFIVGISCALIIMEPDLGTAGIIFFLFFTIVIYRQLKLHSLIILVIIGVISGIFMYSYTLKDYQKKRVLTYLNPESDRRGAGYNAIQSKIAIGSGKLFGKGFMKSTQASLNYLPENHTDFVFSILNEEHGFVGSLFLICLYLVLLFRYYKLSLQVDRLFDSIVIIGIMSLFFFHIFINMSMVTGLMPIVGLPLPFMSYGGSSLMTFSICNGIATSISNSRNLF